MRTRNEIEIDWVNAVAKKNDESQTNLVLEVFLDIRDFLSKKSRKVISTEVNLTDREQEVLDGLDHIDL